MIGAAPKEALKQALQKTLGLHGYVVAHSIFVSMTLRLRRENGDVLAFIDRLRPDSTVLDVGANVGAMTLAFARRCPHGKVYAFEPIPENARAARTVLRLFGVRNAEIHEVAVGDENGALEMVMPTSGAVKLDGLSHVVRGLYNDEGIRYSVPAVRLDDFAPLAGVRVDAMKIDVEDYEQFVIRGAAGIIARDRPLIYTEIWSRANMQGCLDVLLPLGYHVEVLKDGRLHRYDPARGLDPLNFFFLPG